MPNDFGGFVGVRRWADMGGIDRVEDTESLVADAVAGVEGTKGSSFAWIPTGFFDGFARLPGCGRCNVGAVFPRGFDC